ncbi:MAG TPA: SDR family oxidoreductase [Acidimicrobiales bacterium]|nr:SDR family oxidoreductase [Acidimicrobiales bacterium]
MTVNLYVPARWKVKGAGVGRVRIGERAEAVSRPTKTSRYHEEIGLPPAPARRPNDYRAYDPMTTAGAFDGPRRGRRRPSGRAASRATDPAPLGRRPAEGRGPVGHPTVQRPPAEIGKLKPLSQQVVVVMGASSGIGRETALQMAARGTRLVVAARDREALNSLVDTVNAEGGDAVAVTADTSQLVDVDQVADVAVEHFGGFDTWVQAAAVAVYARFEDTTPEEFRRVLEVNVLGNVHAALVALPHLRRRGAGAFISISSVEARRSFPYHAAYAASKHAVDGLLEALRVELRQEGTPVSVTNILPASINTPLFDKARSRLGVKPMPMPPIYQPATVAPLILHAAEHPTRELLSGGAAKALLTTQRISPRLLDALLVRVGFRAQLSDQDDDRADNLDGPLPGWGRSEGSFSRGAWSHSAYNWLETRASLRRLAPPVLRPPRFRDRSEPSVRSGV